MRSRSCMFLLASALLVPAAEGWAQQTDDELELALVYGDRSTVSIATGSRQPLRRAPAVATVITAEDIAAMGATDLDQVLESVPGIHVSRAAGFYASTYHVRGLGTGGPTNPQVLVLQNGIPMTTLYNGDKGQIWAGLPLEHVSRIEIIRGPGSALYGADAYAGVINIITMSAAQVGGTRAGVRAGSFGARDAWVQHGGTAGPLEVSAYLRAGRRDGHTGNVGVDAQTGLDAAFGTRASLAPGPVHTGQEAIDASLDVGMDKWHVRADYKKRDDVGSGAGIAYALDPVTRGRSERFTGEIAWTDPQWASDWSTGASLGVMQYLDRLPNGVQLFPAGARFPAGLFPNGVIGGPSRSERQVRLAAYAVYSGWVGHQWRFGAGHDDLDLYRAETFKNYLLDPAGVPAPTGAVVDYNAIQPHILPHRRKVDYLYVQDEWQLRRDWTLTAGVRHDRYSDFGSTTNPRMALVWDAAHDLTAKLLYGRAFRAPSFNEAYGINPVANGNPGLRPETIGTLEAVLSWQAGRDTELNLNVYRYSARDMIQVVANPAPAPGATFANGGRQRGNGLELALAQGLGRTVRLTASYGYQRSVDETTGEDPGYAPRHHLYARADWQAAPGWMLSPQLNWVAGRRRAAGDARAAIGDDKTMDLVLRNIGSKDRWEFSLTIRNLFNADVREPSLAPGLALPGDLPMPGRAVVLQLAYRL